MLAAEAEAIGIIKILVAMVDLEEVMLEIQVPQIQEQDLVEQVVVSPVVELVILVVHLVKGAAE